MNHRVTIQQDEEGEAVLFFPDAVADELELHEGDVMSIEQHDGALILRVIERAASKGAE